ncbi:MAG: protein kinase [Verrucomicrobiota bacterium JB023]|nr:protein kinase [Verrucomicrobiota bacterium JB023]
MSEPAPQFELPSENELAELLPSYSQITFLAQGGMAAVYRAVQTSLDRPVAIKVLPREFGEDTAFRLRFEAEAKTMAKLNHPNLVGIFDFGEIDGLLYLVMEFVEGESLYHYAYGKTLPEAEAVAFALQVAEGLAHAHEAHVLHRDIKPANILLNQKNVPKLGDFGLAHAGEKAEGDELMFGTPGYTAPEVLQDPESFDERSDVFAVGVLLHELLVGELPRSPYQTPSRLIGCDARVDAVIRKAISPNPALRHASASSLEAELKQLLHQLQTAGRRKLSTGANRPASAPAKVAPTKIAPAKAATARPAVAAPPAPARQPKASAPASPPAAPARPSPSGGGKKSVGPDWSLYRNLIIIAGLCAAIWGALQALDAKKAAQAAKQKEIDEQQKRDAEAVKAAQEQANPSRQNPADIAATPGATPSSGQSTPEPAPEPEPLTPREQLDDLQRRLASGGRSEFPEGTIQRGGSHFFFVNEPMSWHAALRFAEEYGAHLPTLAKESDLRWLGSKMPDAEEMWLGAGATSRDDWGWIDGTEFSHRKPSISLGTAGTLTDIGILKAADPAKKLPFFLEWDGDGSNSGSRNALLTRYHQSKDSSNPSWPPGVLCMDDRRFYIVAEELSHTEAMAEAAGYGGHLAVASNELEAAFLSDVVEEAGLPAVWGGAFLKDGEWAWSTGEGWTFANWATDEPAPNGSALVFSADGWKALRPSGAIAGYIIEWSEDQESAESGPITPDATAGSDLSSLRETAKNFIVREKAAIDKLVKGNSTGLGMRIRQWLRGISQNQSDLYEPGIQLYLGSIDGSTGRMPHPSTVQMISLPAEGAEILDDYYKRQMEADEQLIELAEKIRKSYISKLEGEIDLLEERGLNTKVQQFEAEIDASGQDGRDFLRHLELNPFPIANFTILSATWGSGSTRADVSSLIKENIFDGKINLTASKNLLGEPAPSQYHDLKVEYEMDGSTRTKTIPEGQTLTIP